MADEPLSPSSTEPTPTTSETTTALGDGLAKAPETKSDGPALDLGASKQAPPAAAPEKYEAWKVPEGYELDPEVKTEAEPLFKELGLSQDAAQKLVDLYSKHSIKSLEEHNKSASDWWAKRQQDWREELKRDPQVGKLVGSNGNFGPDSAVVQTVNRALDGLQNPKLVSDFKEAMDLTGAGNNPAFVKVLYALASKVTEGTSYAANGNPVRPNAGRPTPGAAMYPNLRSEAELRGG